MGAVKKIFGGGVKKGPSAEEIRKQEQAKMDKENLARMQEQEAKRASLRANLLSVEDEDEINRKKLTGA